MRDCGPPGAAIRLVGNREGNKASFLRDPFADPPLLAASPARRGPRTTHLFGRERRWHLGEVRGAPVPREIRPQSPQTASAPLRLDSPLLPTHCQSGRLADPFADPPLLLLDQDGTGARGCVFWPAAPPPPRSRRRRLTDLSSMWVTATALEPAARIGEPTPPNPQRL